MNKTRNFQLSADDKKAIERALVQDTHVEVRMRCQALLKLDAGERVVDVAGFCDVTPHTIYTWHDRFLNDGIAGLVNKAMRGRPSKATPEVVAALHAALAQEPIAFGYGFVMWTVERLGAHLAQVTNIVLSDRTLGDLLDRLGYVYTRPKYGLKHLQDAIAVKQAQANWQLLKGGPSAQTIPTAPISSSPWTKRL